MTFTTETIAEKNGCTKWAVLKWAQSNGVAYAGEGRGKIYLWTAADLDRFKQRPRAGRPRSASPKTKK